jgi:predicted secreted Zn-dependent protease
MLLLVAALNLTPLIVDAPRSFASCKAAVAYISQGPEVGKLAYEIDQGYSRTARFSRNGNVLFRVSITLAKPRITLPQWNWSNATASQARNFAEFRASVLSHEQGHWTLARDYLTNRVSAQWLPKAMTRAQAATHFKAYFDEVDEGLQDAQDFYDTISDHGRSQDRAALLGFAGGGDTLLHC